jgi:NADH-quinone oxidoreductase subunit J
MLFLFYLLSAVALSTALMVIFAKSPISSVIHLIITLLALAGHYILLNAQFLAIVHIIVYTGAIMVLFLFVIMLLNLNKKDELHKNIYTKIAAVISSGLIFLILIASLKGVNMIKPLNQFDSSIGLIKTLGNVLFKDFLFPFEISSILFLSAMVGAVMLTKKQT